MRSLAATPSGSESLREQRDPRDIRRRVEDSVDLLYQDMENALRETLRSATKERHVRCPECNKGFRLKTPDHQAVISAVRTLLDAVVGRPKPRETGPVIHVPDDMDAADLTRMSTAELRHLLRATRGEQAE